MAYYEGERQSSPVQPPFSKRELRLSRPALKLYLVPWGKIIRIASTAQAWFKAFNFLSK